MEEYSVIEMQGEHGLIRLHVPNREPTQKEIDDLYSTVAEVAINTYKEKVKAAKDQ